MRLLGAVAYDPASAATKATSSLLAMTAFDTTNLRLAITVPAHGKVRFRLICAVTGATTFPTVLLGVLNGATVVIRGAPSYFPGTANAATQNCTLVFEGTATGLAAGAMNVDAAYAVQVVVASTNIKYGGPNNNSGANAWGAFVFEAWDPDEHGQAQTSRDLGAQLDAAVSTRLADSAKPTNFGTLSIDGSGRVDVAKVAGTAQTARDLGASVLVGDKTGFSLSSAGVQAIWDALTSALTTVGSIGKRIVDFLTGDSYARLGAPAGASVSADIAAAKSDTAAIKAKTDNLPASPAAVGSAMTLTAAYDAAKTAAQAGTAMTLTSGERDSVAAALLDLAAGVETGKTVRQSLRVFLAVLAGKLSGAGTTTIRVRDTGDTKDRVVATVDAAGNRTAVTLDGS